MFSAIEEKPYRLPELPFAEKLNKFLHSQYFLLLLTLLAILANVFGGELYYYAGCGALMLYLCVFGTDLRLVLPLVVTCYLLPGTANNPGQNPASIFSLAGGAAVILIAGAVVVCAVLYRLCVDPALGFRSFSKKKPTLLYGMLALGAAYLLSGVASKGYTQIALKNIGFALLQLIAVALFYLILTYMVHWDRVNGSYLPTVGVLMGILISVELLNVYRINEVIVDGVVNKVNIYLGWGISTNIGLIPVMALPFAFYFICKGKHVILNNLLALLFCATALLTCSRAAILAAGGIYLLCCVVTLIRSRYLLPRILTGVCAAAGVAFVWIVLLGSETLLQTIFANGLESNTRLELYRIGLEFFKKHPIFGSAFYVLNSVENSQAFGWIWSDVDAFISIFPGRWHNTFVQLLASCGIVGLGAYLFHRYQTVRLFIKNRTDEKIFIAVSILALLCMSMLDCHFFNVGPTLIYSCFLAFAENQKNE